MKTSFPKFQINRSSKTDDKKIDSDNNNNSFSSVSNKENRCGKQGNEKKLNVAALQSKIFSLEQKLQNVNNNLLKDTFPNSPNLVSSINHKAKHSNDIDATENIKNSKLKSQENTSNMNNRDHFIKNQNMEHFNYDEENNYIGKNNQFASQKDTKIKFFENNILNQKLCIGNSSNNNSIEAVEHKQEHDVSDSLSLLEEFGSHVNDQIIVKNRQNNFIEKISSDNLSGSGSKFNKKEKGNSFLETDKSLERNSNRSRNTSSSRSCGRDASQNSLNKSNQSNGSQNYPGIKGRSKEITNKRLLDLSKKNESLQKQLNAERMRTNQLHQENIEIVNKMKKMENHLARVKLLEEDYERLFNSFEKSELIRKQQKGLISSLQEQILEIQANKTINPKKSPTQKGTLLISKHKKKKY